MNLLGLLPSSCALQEIGSLERTVTLLLVVDTELSIYSLIDHPKTLPRVTGISTLTSKTYGIGIKFQITATIIKAHTSFALFEPFHTFWSHDTPSGANSHLLEPPHTSALEMGNTWRPEVLNSLSSSLVARSSIYVHHKIHVWKEETCWKVVCGWRKSTTFYNEVWSQETSLRSHQLPFTAVVQVFPRLNSEEAKW